MNKIALFLVFCCCFSACKKKKDETPPTLTIVSPLVNSEFDVPQTISVKAIVKDENDIEFVSIRLVDESLTPVLPTTTNTPEGNYYELNQGYLLEDTRLVSGKYFIRVVASDGENEAKEYVEVKINELPLQRIGIALVSVVGGNQVNISVYNQQSQTIKSHLNFTGDYGGSALSSYHQQLVIAPYAAGQLTAYQMENKEIEWTESSFYEYPHLGLYDDLFYASSTEGEINSYNELGSNISSSQTLDGYVPLKSFKHHNLLLVHEKQATGNIKKLTSYYTPGGAYTGEILNFDYDLTHAASMDEERAMLFFNDGTNGRIFILYTPETENHYTWEPHTLNEGTITAACQIDNDNYIIATTTGVFWYRYSFNSSTLFTTETSANAVKYDPINKQVVVAVGNQLKFFNFPNSSPAGIATHSNTIRDFHFWDNK